MLFGDFRNQLTNDDVKVYVAVLEKLSPDLYPNANKWCEAVSEKLNVSFTGKDVGVRIGGQAAAESVAPAETKLKLFGRSPMAVPVEEAIAALSTFSLEDEQPEIQGPGLWVSTERGATVSPIEYSDVSAYRLSLSGDTKAINQLNLLVREGKEMGSVLYTYRSCVKALPQFTKEKYTEGDINEVRKQWRNMFKNIFMNIR